MSTLRWLLSPSSAAYRAAVALRNLYFDRVRSASCAAAEPVISIGNLTAGGTGKTPMTIEIARRLRAAGCRPVILTRGYKAAPGQAADEVLEFALAAPDVPVVVNPDRVAGAATACQEYTADCLVLDDGFQHRRLRRDLDLVLIDALDPWGGGWLLPAGRLREPLSSLRRADWIVITRSNLTDPAALQEVHITLARRAPNVPVLCAEVRPEALVTLDGRHEPLSSLSEHRLLPVCGIGNSASFVRLVELTAGRRCEPPLYFSDHWRYRLLDVRKIVESALDHGAEWVLTTRKDWVKLQQLWPAASPAPEYDVASAPRGQRRSAKVELLRLDVRMELIDPHGDFAAALKRVSEPGTPVPGPRPRPGGRGSDRP